MHSILKKIINQKYKEVEALKNTIKNFDKAQSNINKNKSFKKSIEIEGLSIIGEIKRKSPSKGDMRAIADPISLLKQYIKGEILAVSVLTDKHYFSGSIEDLMLISEYLRESIIPILRKDFIIDESQIMQSILSGADAILLIVAVLQQKTARLLKYANNLGMDVIVEVHDEEELEYAVEIGAEIIGINNRDLHSFDENINTCLNLIHRIPENILTIAESAIRTPSDIKKISAAGFDAVLIGEALVRSENPSKLLHEMRAVI